MLFLTLLLALPLAAAPRSAATLAGAARPASAAPAPTMPAPLPALRPLLALQPLAGGVLPPGASLTLAPAAPAALAAAAPAATAAAPLAAMAAPLPGLRARPARTAASAVLPVASEARPAAHPDAPSAAAAASERLGARMEIMAAQLGQDKPSQAVPADPRPAAHAEPLSRQAGADDAGAPPPSAPQGPPPPWRKRPGVQIAASVVAAAAFDLGLYLHSGARAAQEFLSTYLIEWTMSLDNVVVLSAALLAAPAGSRAKVMRWALLGTIAARMIMVTAGVGLVAAHAGLFYAFGAFLLATALKMLKPEWDLVGALVKPLARLFKRKDGAAPRLPWLSPVLKVTLAVVGIDALFALDSVPAALAISKSAFVIVAANAFSLVGLRAVVTLLDALEKRFSLLPKGVAAVLLFVGGKMILEPLLGVSFGSLLSAAVIVSLLGGAALLSLLKARARSSGK